MLLILKILFSIITVALAGYGLITRNFEYQGYMVLFMALTMLLTGIQEFQKGKKGTGWLFIAIFVFSLYASIQSFIWL